MVKVAMGHTPGHTVGHVFLGLSFASLCLLVRCQNDTNGPDFSNRTYITDEDTQVLSWSSAAVTEMCAENGFQGSVDADGQWLKDQMGGENIFYNILVKQEAGQDPDYVNLILDEITPAWVASRVFPVTLAILAILVWSSCCWSACPFCRCCRCRRCKQNSLNCGDNAGVKGCFLLMISICFLGVLVMGITTFQGHSQITNGVSNLGCGVAAFVNTTLGGSEDDPPFIGLMPTLHTLDRMDRQLDAHSPLMTDLDQILNATVAIEDALLVTSDTLRLLSDMLQAPQNVKPVNALNESFYHKCVMCEQMGPVVGAAAEALEQGLGQALNTARFEVRSQLTLAKRKKLQTDLRKFATPVIDFKVQIRDALKSAVEPGKFNEVRDPLQSYVLSSVFGVLFCGFLLACCGCCSTVCFVLRPKAGDRFSTMPHRCACCTWCLSFVFIIAVMLLGGIMNVVVIPMAGVCTTLDDIDSNMIDDISGALNLNFTGDERDMFYSMVDSCVAGKDMAKTNLLDIIFTRDLNDNSKVYMRERLLASIKKPVDDAFEDITNATKAGNLTLARNDALVSLRKILKENPIDTMIIADAEELQNDSWYQKMALDEGTAVGFFTSMECLNHTVVGNLGDSSGLEIPGIKHLVARMRARNFASLSLSNGCIEQFFCATVAPPGHEACEAANSFLRLKAKMMDGDPVGSKTFRCDLFEFPKDGPECDVKDMVQKEDGSWSGDCLRTRDVGDKITVRKERYCTLDEFVTYMDEFDLRIGVVIARLDDATKATLSKIVEDLNSVIYGYLIDEIAGIADGVNCGFMPVFVQNVVDGLCFQGVYGFKMVANSFVISAIFVIILAISQYALWRVSIDRVELEEEDGSVPRKE